MRYCVNCGKPLENSRFCTYCGTDNGNEVKATENNNVGNSGVTLNGISLPMLLNWASIILFVVVAYIMLKTGFGQLKYLSVASILYQGIVIPSILFFVLCIWISFPALSLILNADKDQSNKIITLCVINVVIFIVACILNAIFKNFSGRLEIVSLCLSVYTFKAVKVIILSVLAAGVSIFAKVLNQGVR